MSVLLSPYILMIVFMLSPILPPVIGAIVGAVYDGVHRNRDVSTVVAVERAKARTASARAVAVVPAA